MIAPNDQPREPGRNEMCPCNSGRKYKRCCGDPYVKALRFDAIRFRVLSHMLLTKIREATGAAAFIVPSEVLITYPHDCEVKIVKDPASGNFIFAANAPEQEQQVIGPRRIVLPNGRAG